MIEVRGLQCLTAEVLKQEQLFVGQTATRDHADTPRVAGLFKTGDHGGQRLVPVSFNQLSAFTDQRLRQAILAVDVGIAEATTDAQITIVDTGLVVEADGLDFVVLDPEGDGTASYNFV